MHTEQAIESAHCVVINDREVRAGCLKGSALAPVLFGNAFPGKRVWFTAISGESRHHDPEALVTN